MTSRTMRTARIPAAMPLEQRHKRQKRKNFALLGALLGLVAILYGLAMLKLGR